MKGQTEKEKNTHFKTYKESAESARVKMVTCRLETDILRQVVSIQVDSVKVYIVSRTWLK